MHFTFRPKIICLLIMQCIFACAFSQSYIGKSKEKVQKDFGFASDPGQDSLTGSFQMKENYGKLDYILKFDKQQKCYLEKIIFQTELAYQYHLDRLLKDKKYEWKKINENQYATKFSEYMMLELPPEKKDLTITLLKVEWSKETYKLLTGE